MSGEHDLSAMENEMHLIAARLREKYDLDTVVMLSLRQVDTGKEFDIHTTSVFSGNIYAGKHLALRYSKS